MIDKAELKPSDGVKSISRWSNAQGNYQKIKMNEH